MEKENQKRRSMKLQSRSKKGTLLDLAFIGVFLFAFGIIITVIYPVFVEINDNLASSGQMTNETLGISTKVERKFVSITDGIFLFILIGLSIAALIGAMMINTHPAFYFVAAALLGFFAVINAIFANAFSEIASASLISDYSSDFLITSFVMQHFPFIALVISFIIVIILLSKGGT